MINVFCSGSCRLLSLSNTNNINVIHYLSTEYFKGKNFMGKFHDTKQHIQFINFLKNNISIEENILKKIFTSYNKDKWLQLGRYLDDINTFNNKKNFLSKNFENCDVFIFEICSIKTYKFKNYYCQYEQNDDNNIDEYDLHIQSSDELYEDLRKIIDFFPNKIIIFQCHFRPNIIYDNNNLKIEKREIIYNTLLKICDNKKIFLHDPSEFIKLDKILYDGDTHFTEEGIKKNSEKIIELINNIFF
jgi:hypothetical protein